jgi:hypothetical protein
MTGSMHALRVLWWRADMHINRFVKGEATMSQRPIDFEYVDEPSVTWIVPYGSKGKMHLCADDGNGKACMAAFTFSRKSLQDQLDALGAGLPAALAREDGVELQFDTAQGSFALTVSNLATGAPSAHVRLECWVPPNKPALRFSVPHGSTDTRRVFYA